jgi:hypothetical protein
MELHLDREGLVDIGGRSAHIDEQTIGVRARDGKSLRLGERNNAVVVSLRRTVLLKKLLRSEVLTIVRSRRITLFL